MAQLTPLQEVQKMLDNVRAIQELNKPLETGVRTVMAAQSQRIFARGEGTNGKIGSYNTTNELWIGDDRLPRAGTHKGKTGKAIKTSYYASYAAARKQQNRQVGFVDIRFTNDLQSDFANAAVSGNTVVIPKPIRVNQHHYKVNLKRPANIQKRRGLENRYGPIFNLTSSERRLLNKVTSFELNKALR